MPYGSVATESLSSIIEATARELLGHQTALAQVGDDHDERARDHVSPGHQRLARHRSTSGRARVGALIT